MAKVPDTSENMNRCICATCPSYPGEGGFFCAKGKSDREVDQRGCVCQACPIHEEFGLTGGYYCVEGQAQ